MKKIQKTRNSFKRKKGAVDFGQWYVTLTQKTVIDYRLDFDIEDFDAPASLALLASLALKVLLNATRIYQDFDIEDFGIFV